jgi:hypothetical protein
MDPAIAGFASEIEKNAGVAKTFARGALISVPVTMAFKSVEHASLPPHIDARRPGQKFKQLGKDIATGAAGWGAFDVAYTGLKKRMDRQKPAGRQLGLPFTGSAKVKAKGKDVAKLPRERLGKRLGRYGKWLGRGSLYLGAGLAAAGVAEAGMHRLLNKKKGE